MCRSRSSWFVCALFLTGAGAAHAADAVEFNRDIRPILADKCFACHGPDSGQRKAGLRLDTDKGARADLGGLSFDLLGLPPTPKEIAAFLADNEPDAYERLVDRLLASPHYGERMAVYWLDLVRYADTVGYHGDQEHHISPYRDYVIKAFNKNLPFDQFTAEQLAGDLLPGATVEQKIASGYNRLLL